MADESAQRSIRELANADTDAVGLGIIESIETDGARGYLLTVTLQPEGRECQARVMNGGTRPGGGLLWPLEVGDEVLVLFPNGDPNLAVAMGGLNSTPDPLPTSYDNTTPQITHPNGIEIRSDEGDEVQGLVKTEHLIELQNFVSALQAFMATTSTATSASQIATAAVTFLADLGVQSYVAGLAQSATEAGALPFASETTRSS